MPLGKSAMLLPSLLLLFLFAATASGTPFTTLDLRTTCPTPSTVGAYVNIPVNCDTGNVNSYVAFTGFTSSPSAIPMTIQALANSGFYFPENLNGPQNFTVGFNAQTFNGLANSVTLDLTANSPPQGQATVTLYECSGNAMDCVTNPNRTVTIGANSPAQTIYFDPTPKLGLLLVGNVDAVSTLTQFEVTIGMSGSTGVNGTIPEPATLMLMGAGLVGIALFRRRRA